jgi:zinc protease
MSRNLLIAASLALSVLFTAVAQEGDRSAPPPPGPPPALTLPPIQHFRLKCGLPVVLVEKHGVPIVQLNLLVGAGSAMDPAGKRGVASLTATMMMEGAGARNALVLADAIDYLGATITSTSGQHEMALRLHTPVARLDSACVLFADVAMRPQFPADELDRKRSERLTGLMQWRDEPRILSSVAFNRALYGDVHTYGVPVTGDERSLKSITTADLRAFHASWYRPNNATLIVVGDVKPKSLLPKLEKVFGTWARGSAAPPALPPIEQVKRRSVIIVDKPGAAQTVVRIGRIGVPRTTEDFAAIVVMNTILGGSFTSRLNNNLREQKGYTYGAGSAFDFRPLPGPFVATASVQAAVTAEALTEFFKELKDILEPVTDAEITRAKNYVALSYPADFQTVRDIAYQIEELVTYRFPDDTFNRHIGRILAVTAPDVQRVARMTIDPASVVIVLVGDRKVIEGPVASLGLGPVEVRSIDDILGKPPVIEPAR